MKKICFVVQRYGLEVNGGAEYLCRLYAERMTQYYEVTVLTSCAIDHVTWENEYPIGDECLNGVKILRFPVTHERNMESFSVDMQKYLQNTERDFYDDFVWLAENGPEVPELYCFIRKNKDQYAAFLFMGYMYYPTTFCMYEVADKAIMIPTAHNEIILRECHMFRALFHLPAGIIFLTEEEKRFVHQYFKNEQIPSIVTGSGIVMPDQRCLEKQKDIFLKNGINPEEEYIIYVGRVEAGKSCDLLFHSFIDFKNRYGGETKLVLVGKEIMEVPDRSDIISMGFVSEEEKFALVQNAKLLVLSSRQESLSLVVLEAMTAEIPVIVNANCEVLKGHIDKSNGGLYFYQQEDLVQAIHYLLTHDETRIKMGANGKKYVQDYYEWDIIDRNMIEFIERTAMYEKL